LIASREVAAVAVIVDAEDDNAVAFYRRYEFTTFVDDPNRLFLPMGTIERLFSGYLGSFSQRPGELRRLSHRLDVVGPSSAQPAPHARCRA
jgi:hypothetical protein